MKKAIIALIVSTVLFALVPQQVKAYDHLTAQNWANQNGYGRVSLINNRVVYDSGCWKPEFPNNPFCK